MKRFSLFAGCLLALCAFSGSKAHGEERQNWNWTTTNKYTLIGDFSLIGFARWHSVILSNNMVYMPQKKYRRIVDDWNQGDSIRVLQTEHKSLVLLINLRTGESVKAKPHEVHK